MKQVTVRRSSLEPGSGAEHSNKANNPISYSSNNYASHTNPKTANLTKDNKPQISSEVTTLVKIRSTTTSSPNPPMLSKLVTQIPDTKTISSLLAVKAEMGLSISKKSGSKYPIKAQRYVRPTLTEQLADIAAKAEGLTREIRQTHGLSDKKSYGTPLHCFPANAFAVGTLNCRYPSPVSFYQDRCEYNFYHPHERSEIKMVMFYKHWSKVLFSSGRLRFTLSNRLTLFKDFDPSNSNHSISIEMPASALLSVKALIS